jgi:transposase
VRGSPVWREKENLLASVPGVGKVIARTMVADLPELGTVGRKQISALAGLAPLSVSPASSALRWQSGTIPS